MSRLFCFGLGYCALALARRLQADGWSIAGTCRTEEKAAEIRASDGFTMLVRGSDAPPVDPRADLAGATHILVSAAPDEHGDPILGFWRDAVIERAGSLAWVGYLSTTGVYGDRAGGWVDETSDRAATNRRSLDRIAAEDAWLALFREHAIPVHLFRLAGIYGPGRSALDAVRAGRAQRIIKEGQVFSRVHVDDIVQTLMASMRRPQPGTAYNVCDDHPAPPDAVITHACVLLGQEPPPPIPFEAARLTPMAASFYTDNRRVANRRIKDDLRVVLKYPTYETGLKALFDQGF